MLSVYGSTHCIYIHIRYVLIINILVTFHNSLKMKSLICGVFCVILAAAILDEAHSVGKYQFFFNAKITQIVYPFLSFGILKC